VGKTQVFRAEPPFEVIATLDTGPITNHVNFVRNKNGQFAYVSVGGENVVKVFTTGENPKLVATIPTGELPHGIWPSGDGTHMYACRRRGGPQGMCRRQAAKKIPPALAVDSGSFNDILRGCRMTIFDNAQGTPSHSH
jgi:hypothetical protein